MRSVKVFVAHGRDLLAREAVTQVLRELGLAPVVLGNIVRVGENWLEGLETASRDVEFAVVIFKGDDWGALWSSSEAQTARARQNVLFELGFMIGKLGRSKVCVLYEEGVEVPSDYAGAKFVRLGGEWDWKLHLAVALREAGLPVKLNDVIEGASVHAPRDQEFIRDHAQRTRQIVADLRALKNSSAPHREIRFSGFLSSFALGPHEMLRRSDGTVLTEEHDEMIARAREGCQVFCIISMPTRVVEDRDVLGYRLTTLLKFLKSNDSALENIYWAIAPRVESYVYVIGDVSVLQGFKSDAMLKGFALTERRTSLVELHAQAALFDERFNIHAKETLALSDVQREGNRREDLLRATTRKIEAVCEAFSFVESNPSG